MFLELCTNNSSIPRSEVKKLTTLFVRTILIYALLLLSMRLMGKRQIGELEFSDFVTTLLISEIASTPISDPSIPMAHAIVPIGLVVIFEVLSSTLLAKFPKLKNLITARPSTLIQNGKICAKAMRRSRLSADELVGELRRQNICDLSEIQYAILEQNGKITAIPWAKYRPPTAEDLKLQIKDTGLCHIAIDKGAINHHTLKTLNIEESEFLKELKQQDLSPKDIYLMTINDAGEQWIIKNSDV